MKVRSTVFLASFLALWLATAGCTGGIGGRQTPTGSGAGAAGTSLPGAGGSAAGTNLTGAAGMGGGTGTAGAGSALRAGPLLRLANYEFLNSLRDILQFNADVPLEPDAPSDGDFRIGGPAGDNTVSNYRAAAISLATQALKTLAKVEPCFGTATT